MYKLLAVLVLVVAVASEDYKTTDVTQCVRFAGELPINTYIEGCETPPCQLPQLQDAVLNIVFRAPRTMLSMQTHAVALIPTLGSLPDLSVPYDLGGNAVTCNFLGNTYCPVLATEVVEYTLRMQILSIFPTDYPVTLEFYVQDTSTGTAQPVFCLRVPIVVVPPVDPTRVNQPPIANQTLVN